MPARVAAVPDLLDVNVWLALVDENHVHHAAAKRYWHEQASGELVFTRVTMLGFLRLSTAPRVLSRPLSPAEAWATYRQFRALPEIRFLGEAPELESCFATLSGEADAPRHLWTDAYLAAFALTAGCRLVSFDADFARFPRLTRLHLPA